MPEGDTLHRTASRLRPALAGQRLEAFESTRIARRLWPRPGTLVSSVEAEGKHLYIAFEGGWRLHTHLGMTGSWHLYPVGGRWRKPQHLARVQVQTPGWVAVCFSPPTVQMVPPAGPGSASPTAHLGPDLCREDTDPTDAVARIDSVADPGDSVADVLLDQRIAAGVGNVYKSEVLWACRVSPFEPIGAVPPETRVRLFSTAAKLLRANLGGGSRATVDGGLAVYSRRGSPCRRCGTAISMRRHGVHARSTYWCPTCQPAGAGPPGSEA